MERTQSKAGCFGKRFTIELDEGLAAAFGRYLYFPPPYPLYARAQGFHHSFFAGKAARQPPRFMLAELEFVFRVYPAEKTLTPAVDSRLYTRYFDDVNAYRVNQFLPKCIKGILTLTGVNTKHDV